MTVRGIDLLIESLPAHFAAGHRLYPLRPGTKHALDDGWRTKRYTQDDLVRTLRAGHSVGLGRVLGPGDLVVDVDPRHEGALDDLAKLTDRLTPGEDLAAETVCVMSGGRDRGTHYYMRFDPAVNDDIKLRTKIKDFGSLEFKTRGDTITVPYSVHPDTGELYYPHFLSAQELLTVPEWLRTMLTKSAVATQQRDYQAISDTELTQLLDQLPIEDFDNNDDWLRVLMASHHATDGQGLEAFLAWSLSDPAYADQRDLITLRWESMHDDSDVVITLATLNKLVSDRGGQPLPLRPILLTPDATTEYDATARLVKVADRMDPATPGAQIEQCLRDALDLGPLAYSRVRRTLLKAIGISAGELNDYVSRLKLRIRDEQNKIKAQKAEKRALSKKSLALVIARKCLDQTFDTKLLIHATNQQFYRYTGTHWEPIADNVLTRIVFDTAETLYTEYPKIADKIVQLIEPAKTALVALTATPEDLFGWSGEPKPVINCHNGELWLDTQSGSVDLRPHRYSSYLLNCLPINYDPDATCPRFDQALLEIFDQTQNPAEVVRHLWEIVGYIIQPRKNIPAYFIFHGRGANGKTFLSRIMMALIGLSNVLPRSITDFLGNTNTHALASLPGKLLMVDDDADIAGQLPEAALKKLAETKEFEANPKYCTPFNFKSTASPLILTNDWPRIKDLSYGMLRKAYVVPFRRRFADDEQDRSLAETIMATEMSGVLNRAIEGHFRLRKRQRFEIPQDCLAAFDEWLSLANPLVSFVDNQCQPNGNGSVLKLAEIYAEYRNWCLLSGIRHPVQQSTFELSLLQLGYDVTGQDIRGLQLRH